jgi:hypothetical protein
MKGVLASFRLLMALHGLHGTTVFHSASTTKPLPSETPSSVE